MNLLILESPGKVKKVQSILGSDWKVAASVGHAVGRLRDTLAAQGWLTDVPRLFESSGLNLDTNVTFAPAEAVQEDYDANEDPSLKDEF